MLNYKKVELFFRLHWIKLIVVVCILVLFTSLAFFIRSGLNEWKTVDAITKQRTVAGAPFQLYMSVVTGIFMAFVFGLMWLYILSGGGQLRSFSHKGNTAVKGKDIGVNWNDVIGMDEAKKEAREVVGLIKDRTKIEESGGSILKGVLLLGPPGCGKTYLAKAIATDANLPFLTMAGSEFNELFVGVGARRIRMLFKKAREIASVEGGCIIFIDEIDAFALTRSVDLGFGAKAEVNSTLNQLLVEMDGLRSKKDNIVVFGATNMAEKFLDPAFLRPGRFDRKIVVDLPDIEDRKKTFQYYLSKIDYDENSVSSEKLAAATVGSSPAEIVNIVHEAVIIAQRNKKSTVTMKEISEARERISLGIKRKFKMSNEEKSRLSYYEAGHILVTYLLVPTKDVFKATIIPRGKDVVSALLTEKEEVLSRDKNLLLAEIRICLAGYACEKMKFGVTSDTSENDLRKATELIHNMVWRWGMGKSGHMGNFENQWTSHLVREDLDQDVEETIDLCFQEINNLIRQNWEIIERLAKELIEKEELDYYQIEAIFKEFGKMRPTKEAVRIQERQVIKTGVTWDDVVGMDEVKQEAREVVELIKDRARLQRVGGKIIKGLLMFGPPGCGKTYLASAIATEFDLPFIYKSGSEFEQMYVGVGAMRVRRMFLEAKEMAQTYGGCIIFIDELDAIGGRRARGEGFDVESPGVRNQTINQLLTEMDGLKGKDADYNIIVIGATNMPEKYFDPALLRPGRFDRKLTVYLPNLEDREKLFEYYLSKVQYDKDSVRIDRMARITSNYTPADISNLVQEAAILCIRNKKEVITMQEISEAMERIRLGLRLRFKVSRREKECTAYHETGHAIITYLCEPKRDTFKLSIVPRSRTLGVSWSGREESREFTKEEASASIMCSLGGYVAEKIKFGGNTGAGVGADFENIMSIAHDMVYKWGMGDSGFLGNFSSLFLTDRSTEPMMSEQMMARLDEDVQKILNRCMKDTEEILTKERPLLDKLAAELLEKEELDYDQIEGIFKSFGKMRPPVER